MQIEVGPTIRSIQNIFLVLPCVTLAHGSGDICKLALVSFPGVCARFFLQMDFYTGHKKQFSSICLAKSKNDSTKSVEMMLAQPFFSACYPSVKRKRKINTTNVHKSVSL